MGRAASLRLGHVTDTRDRCLPALSVGALVPRAPGPSLRSPVLLRLSGLGSPSLHPHPPWATRGAGWGVSCVWQMHPQQSPPSPGGRGQNLVPLRLPWESAGHFAELRAQIRSGLFPEPRGRLREPHSPAPLRPRRGRVQPVARPAGLQRVKGRAGPAGVRAGSPASVAEQPGWCGAKSCGEGAAF